MIQHRDFLIYASALPLPPPSSDWRSEGIVLKQGRAGSVVEVGRIRDPGATFDLRELAEYYGGELCRIVIDECLT